MKKRIILITIIGLFLLMAEADRAESVIPGTDYSETSPISVVFTFDKEECEVNTELTVSYSVTGGSGSYTDIAYDCYTIDGSSHIHVANGSLDEPYGRITFTPSIGQTAYVSINVEDADSGSCIWVSDYLPLICPPTSQETIPVLSGINISDVFPDTALQELISNHFDFDQDGFVSDYELSLVSTLWIDDQNIERLDGLEKLTTLKELYVWGMQLETKPSLLLFQNYTSIEKLCLPSSGFIGNLSALSHLTTLKELNIWENDIEGDLSAVSGLTGLESLDIGYTNIGGNISALGNLTALKHLALSYDPNVPKNGIDFVGTLSSLSSLSSLEELYLLNVGIEGDITDVLPLSNLTTLSMIFDFTGDISAISALSHLQDVDLRSSYATFTIDDRILQLTNLRQFSTTFIKYTGDISVLGQIESLNGIMIYYCDYQLPVIHFIPGQSITIDIPRISEEKKLIPVFLDSFYGTYDANSITWCYPADSTEGEYIYNVSVHIDEDWRFTCISRVIQPYTAVPAPEDMNTLYLPDSLAVIESEAFSNLACQAIIIPEGCTSIGEYAFAGCTNLIYVKIPSTINSYPESAFDGCNDNLVIDWAKE